MQRNVVAPALLAVLLCGMLLVVGCPQKNSEPVFSHLTATPNDTVLMPTAVVALKVAATDTDGDALTFTWSKSAGSMPGTYGDSVVWTAPAEAGVCTVTVKCSDGDAEVDTNRIMRVRAWMRSSIDAFTPDSTYLPNVGTIEIPFTWDLDDELPPGAITDSMMITLEFDNSDTLELEQFNVYLISPRGTRVMLYDGVEQQQLDLSMYDVIGFAGEPVAGTWKLRFERNNPNGYNGVVQQCDLDIEYSY